LIYWLTGGFVSEHDE